MSAENQVVNLGGQLFVEFGLTDLGLFPHLLLVVLQETFLFPVLWECSWWPVSEIHASFPPAGTKSLRGGPGSLWLCHDWDGCFWPLPWLQARRTLHKPHSSAQWRLFNSCTPSLGKEWILTCFHADCHGVLPKILSLGCAELYVKVRNCFLLESFGLFRKFWGNQIHKFPKFGKKFTAAIEGTDGPERILSYFLEADFK